MKQNYLNNVVTLKYNADLCIGCGRCVEVCPHHVFEKLEKKAMLIDKNRCMECGACKKNCPTKAIQVTTGVGCAYAIIMGWMMGSEPTCGCSDSQSSSCC